MEMFVWALVLVVAVLVSVLVGYLVGRKKSDLEHLGYALDLHTVPFLQNLSQEDAEKLRSYMTFMSAPEGSLLIKENDDDNQLFFLVSGTVNVLKGGRVHDAYINQIQAGEFFGEIAFLTGHARLASVKASEHCQVLGIRQKDFAEISRIVPAIHDMVWNACETHMIGLLIADNPELRALQGPERTRWIDGRSSLGHVDKPFEISEGIRWIAVIMGQVKIKQKAFTAPDLIMVSEGDHIEPLGAARICLLAYAVRQSKSSKSA